MAAKKGPENDLLSVLIAILAALKPSQDLLENPGPALRDAARLVAKTRELMANDFRSEIDVNFGKFWAEIDFAKGWGFVDGLVSQGGMPLSEAVQQSWCRYKTELRLAKFLREFGYPKEFLELGIVTEAGYNRVVANQTAKNRVKDAARKRQAHGKQVPKPKKGNL